MKTIPVCEPLLLGNELKYVTEAIQTGWISSSGQYVKAFEEAFAKYCGAKYAVGVCNGTAALHLALRCLGIGPGDEVIIPSFTMIATAFAVCYTGAMPVFVDANPKTWNIDVTKIEEKITKKTKAIIPVHIFGLPCDMHPLQKIVKQHKLQLIEDAAEAHGAEYRGQRVGSFSDIAAFSFFANKNLTTGEGGMVVMNEQQYSNQARYFKNLCFPLDTPRDYLHADIGFNYRMSNIHAALGLAQVEKADEYKALRIRNGKLYRKLLAEVPGIAVQGYPETIYENVFWMNGILLDTVVYGRPRDELMAILQDSGVETRKFFNGMHRQVALKKYGCNVSETYSVCDNLADNGLYLPSGSGLLEKQIAFICEIIKKHQRG